MIKKQINKFITKDIGTLNGFNRDKWIKDSLSALPKGSSILDAGAGESKYKKFCGHLKYTSQDIAEYDGQGDGYGIQTQTRDYSNLDIISDITSIPVEDGSFDSVMCIEVFEHLPDPLLALKELKRILKPGGTIIITAPFNSLTHYAPYHYSTGFSKYYYQHHLENYGFKEITIKNNGDYFQYLAQEIRRLKSVGLKYSNTKANILQKISIYMILRLLLKFQKNDHGSHELLNFGYFVTAVKL